jgi:hypothetical protein
VWNEVIFPSSPIITKIFGPQSRGSNQTAMSYYAIDTTGKLYAWGNNAWGQLGLNNTTNQTTPQLVTALSSKVIVDLSVSANNGISVIALDSTGQIYTWGYDGQGSTYATTLPAASLMPTL